MQIGGLQKKKGMFIFNDLTSYNNCTSFVNLCSPVNMVQSNHIAGPVCIC